MAIIVDIIIVAIIALSIFLGYKKGLIKCAINILSFFIALIVVILLTRPISNLIVNATNIDERIEDTILSTLNIEDAEDIEAMKLTEENSDTPEVIREYINDSISNMANDAKEDVAKAVAENIAIAVINIAVALILFVGTKIALIFIKGIADIFAKIPLLKQFNKAGGIVYGIISGFVAVYLILALTSIFAPMISDGSIISGINESYIGSMMYNNNLLLKIIF